MSKKIHCDRLKTANTLKAYLLREKNPRKEKKCMYYSTVLECIVNVFDRHFDIFQAIPIYWVTFWYICTKYQLAFSI